MRDLTTTPETARRARARLLLPVTAALLLLLGASPHAAAQARQPTDADRKRLRDAEKVEAEARQRRPMVNLKPFEDVAFTGKRLAEEGRIGWETTAEVAVTAERAADGRLKPESVKISWLSPADEPLSALVQRTVAALSESRVLSALEGAKTVRIAFKLTREDVSFGLDGEMPSAAEAERYAHGYDVMRQYGLMSKRSEPEGALYQHLRFTSDGKVFKMSFGMPRREANRVVAVMLARRAAKAANQD